MNTDINKAFKEYQKENYNKKLNKKLKDLIKTIPDSNGSRYYKKFDKTIGIITDEFMYNYYKDAVNLIYINYFDYKSILENNDIDIFMFVSCWRGMDNNDWRAGNPNGALQKESIYEVIEICKEKGIPTVFQSIEDPSNYGSFADIAKRCNYIFTTDKDKINDYKNYCNNENVFLLEYGVNPLFHNPIGIKNQEKLDAVLFAGSWMKRYSDRCNDMIKLFDGVLESGKKLDIIDRNFNLEMEPYYYPKKYIPYTTEPINHLDLQKVQKLYNWIINLNSIKYSSTMCAMRIYEAQALGNILLSNYSISVNNYNPNVFIINEASEVSRILNGFSEEEIYNHQVYGIRNVMTDKTVFERLDYIFKTIGVEYEKCREKSILVIVKNKTVDLMKMFESQTYINKFLVEESKAINIYNQYDFVTFFNENYIYEEYYLQDMINGFKYSNSDYITKDSYYVDSKLVDGIEHDFIKTMKDKYKTIFDSKAFSLKFLLEIKSEILLENGYSIDHFELIVKDLEKIKLSKFNMIKEKSKSFFLNYTKKLNFKNIINKSEENLLLYNTNMEMKSSDYNLSIIIPIYNNGKKLLNKCFNSLKRSSMFEKMEIILVDDGSTDLETMTIINRIEIKYPNVYVYRFEQGGGSGSASRARNKGIELARSKYITFLDPDNEAINDGYYKLYNSINEENYDMVIGYMIVLDNREGIVQYYKKGIINNPKEHLINDNFRVNSIQAAIIRKDLIIENDLDMVEGAIGQDTLFFIELMINSKKVLAIDEAIHIYYASVEDSVTNKINKNFFEKSYLLEKEMVKRLDKYNLKDIYVNLKLEKFFKNWYMEKLKQIESEEIEVITNYLIEILNVYNYENIKDKDILRLVNYVKLKKYKEILEEYVNIK